MNIPSPEEIRMFRIMNKDSQAQAGAKVGYSQVSWMHFEAGKRPIPISAWAVYCCGGLVELEKLINAYRAAGKFRKPPHVEQEIPDPFTPAPEPVYQVQTAPMVEEEHEPTGVWDVKGERLISYWGAGPSFEMAVGKVKEGNPLYEFVYDDVQSWIADMRQRKAFADHFGFDYDEEA